MQNRLNLVAHLRHIKKSAIDEYQHDPHQGKVFIRWSADRKIPFTRANVSFAIDPSRTVGGKVYKITLSASLKSPVKEFEPGLLLLLLESGETLVLGNPDLPVTILLPESLLSKSLEITHESWHKPYLLTI